MAADLPDVDELLTAAVDSLGGQRREGQVTMAEAVAQAIEAEEHLVVQAGTGTGKSLAYLVPALRHALASGSPVVVSTATIALQRQLIERDLPRLAGALTPMLGREPTFAILKGRRNYLCRHRLQTASETDPDEAELFDPRALSSLGRQIKRLHEWSEETISGDRDELVPGVSDLAWRQVSVTANECLGAGACPFGQECFAEQARAEAGEVDVVVTNHALLAIDATQNHNILPEHHVLVIDEAHELVDRVTSMATGLLTEKAVATAAKRASRLCEPELTERLTESGDGLAMVFTDAEPGRIDHLPEALAGAVAGVRDAAHGCVSAIGTDNNGGTTTEDPEVNSARKLALSALEEVHDTAVRVLESFEPPLRDRTDIVWLTKSGARSPSLHVAPLSVGGLLREKLFGERTTVLTSATLALGGSFTALASQWGLGAEGADAQPSTGEAEEAHAGGAAATGEEDVASDDTAEARPLPRWRGIDVGSPFDHARSGILYVATHLPPPGRDGLDSRYLDEIAELIGAAGGRTLGLFSSMRAATQATEELRERLDHPILCQGEDSTGQLVREFAEDERACLFGTLSLWQGVDVPGPALQLVIVDRLPFPRPDDPLASARQRAVGARGGNGFMAVAATHAALLLAQGTGRLLRSVTDKGVVAVLDPRLATARYSGFLRSSLPPYWATTDAQVARAALKRLDEAAAAAARH
ncbi:ATP-dependent DNA helicase [Salinactinospora qingdaonensis]|uniref:DNA 5'-3' helicase n=1 Tax=Salinactinospora qingdaonensis TaxID=702744 RepID=A0ABP7EUT4_9ACTN